MIHEITVRDLSQIDKAASRFISEIGSATLLAFHAPMGAGKTTFITALCRVLGVDGDAVSSPTFSIVNEYRKADGGSIFHFDFYRITKTSEALDIGLFEYLDSGCLCLMEWPENIGEILPDETLNVSIKALPDESRIISWED